MSFQVFPNLLMLRTPKISKFCLKAFQAFASLTDALRYPFVAGAGQGQGMACKRGVCGRGGRSLVRILGLDTDSSRPWPWVRFSTPRGRNGELLCDSVGDNRFYLVLLRVGRGQGSGREPSLRAACHGSRSPASAAADSITFMRK